MAVPFSPPDIRDEDIDAVVKVLRSGWITSGPVCREFEAALVDVTGAGGVITLNSCTAALEISLRTLGIGPGDEVIVPAYTYSASAAVISHVGAQIVMVDNAPGEYIPSAERILAAVTPRTKAVIVVDLAGVPFDTLALRTALEGSGVESDNEILSALGRPAVIADAAHSLGGVLGGLRVGELGDFTCYSFHAVKNLTTAEGGAIAWRADLPAQQDQLATNIRQLSLHGQSKDALSKMHAGAWEYDIVELGYKHNMPDTLAALGLSQLSRYEDQIARRHQIVETYDSLLGDSFGSLSHSSADVRSSAHLYLLNLRDHAGERDSIIRKMAEDGISTNVHYKPLPMFTGYKELGFNIDDYPNSYNQYLSELTLPLYSLLSDRDVSEVSQSLLRAIG